VIDEVPSKSKISIKDGKQMSIENEVSEFLSNDDTRIDGIKTSHRMDTQNNVAENGASGI